MANSIQSYEAVWFDAGDTLVTIPETHKLFERFLADHSIMRSEDQIVKSLNEAFSKVYYGHKPDAFAACTPESDRRFWVMFYQFVLDRLELLTELDEAKAHQMCHELYELYTSPEHYVLFEDVLPVLDALQSKGLKLAVISNFAPTLRTILADKGVAGYFDPIVVSTLVGLEKPDPRIFRHTLDMTGFNPHEVLYVGDHEVNDVWAPAQVGIRSVRIIRYDYQSGEGIRTLHELLNL